MAFAPERFCNPATIEVRSAKGDGAEVIPAFSQLYSSEFDRWTFALMHKLLVQCPRHSKQES